MEIKKDIFNELIDMYNEGKAFENSTKEVEIEIRGKIRKFNIRPMSYEESIKFTAAQMKINTRTDNPDSPDIDFEDTTGTAILNIVTSNTVEFSDLTDKEVEGYGAKSKADFIARILGKKGVPALFNHIQGFTSDNREKKEDEADESAQILKN